MGGGVMIVKHKHKHGVGESSNGRNLLSNNNTLPLARSSSSRALIGVEVWGVRSCDLQ